MSLPKRAQILPDRVPISSEELDAFSQAFRDAAQKRGLTVQQSGRYEAWALAFLSWCHEEASPGEEAERIEAFRTALRERGAVGEEAVHEAMDALSFLFGAARTALGTLTIDDFEEGTREERGAHRPLSDKEVFTLQTHWEEGHDCPEQNASSDSPSPGDDDSDGGSTADHCIQDFHAQLDTLHSAESDSE